MRKQLLLNMIKTSSSLEDLETKVLNWYETNKDIEYVFDIHCGVLTPIQLASKNFIKLEKDLKDEYVEFVCYKTNCVSNNFLFNNEKIYSKIEKANIYFFNKDKINYEDKAKEILDKIFKTKLEIKTSKNMITFNNELKENFNYTNGCYGDYFLFGDKLMLFNIDNKKGTGNICFFKEEKSVSIDELLFCGIKTIYSNDDAIKNNAYLSYINSLLEKITF